MLGQGTFGCVWPAAITDADALCTDDNKDKWYRGRAGSSATDVVKLMTKTEATIELRAIQYLDTVVDPLYRAHVPVRRACSITDSSRSGSGSGSRSRFRSRSRSRSYTRGHNVWEQWPRDADGNACVVKKLHTSATMIVQAYAGKEPEANSLPPQMFAQVLAALQRFAACAFVHGDVKPANLMTDVAKRRARFIDFGQSFVTRRSVARRYDIAYMAVVYDGIHTFETGRSVVSDDASRREASTDPGYRYHPPECVWMFRRARGDAAAATKTTQFLWRQYGTRVQDRFRDRKLAELYAAAHPARDLEALYARLADECVRGGPASSSTPRDKWFTSAQCDAVATKFDVYGLGHVLRHYIDYGRFKLTPYTPASAAAFMDALRHLTVAMLAQDVRVRPTASQALHKYRAACRVLVKK